MENKLQIIEKPDWVTWEDIHNVLWQAHAQNRKKGIIMRFPSLPGEEIRQFIEDKGKMFCIIAEGKVVGTGAIILKNINLWTSNIPEVVGYQCFVSVLPNYKGKGIYKQFNIFSENYLRQLNINKLMMDTHERNMHIQNILKKNNYKFVDYKFYFDHYNVVMMKWLDGCPYSETRLKYEYFKRKLKIKLKRYLSFLKKK